LIVNKVATPRSIRNKTTDALTNLKTKAPNDDSTGVKTGQSTLYQYHSYGQAKKNHHHHLLLLLLPLDSFLLKIFPLGMQLSGHTFLK
jgi:hypothetical protein